MIELTERAVILLRLLADSKEGMGLSQMARVLKTTPIGAASALLPALKAGLVDRRGAFNTFNPSGRCVWWYTITDMGREWLDQHE